MANTSSQEPTEPDAFTSAEFAAWRGLLRLHSMVTRELERRLVADGVLSLGDYSILITLVGAPGRRLAMSELARRRLLHPSRVTRVVARLEREGLVSRESDDSDARSVQAVLTAKGLERLRAAQVTHHGAVRELYLGRLTEADRQTLSDLLEKAMPGVVSADVWPPYE
jgi:DNA-binding MarR family transcriptional regulator